MLPSTDDIARLRRMIAEPTDATYNDGVLSDWLQRYALTDKNGVAPQYIVTYTPPTYATNPNWLATWDFNAVAADVWSEKAGALASRFDFRDDRGQTFSRSQAYQQAAQQARYYRSRRSPSSVRLVPETGRKADSAVVNGAE